MSRSELKMITSYKIIKAGESARGQRRKESLVGAASYREGPVVSRMWRQLGAAAAPTRKTITKGDQGP